MLLTIVNWSRIVMVGETSPPASTQGIFRSPLARSRPPNIECDKVGKILPQGDDYCGLVCSWTSGLA